MWARQSQLHAVPSGQMMQSSSRLEAGDVEHRLVRVCRLTRLRRAEPSRQRYPARNPRTLLLNIEVNLPAGNRLQVALPWLADRAWQARGWSGRAGGTCRAGGAQLALISTAQAGRVREGALLTREGRRRTKRLGRVESGAELSAPTKHRLDGAKGTKVAGRTLAALRPGLRPRVAAAIEAEHATARHSWPAYASGRVYVPSEGQKLILDAAAGAEDRVALAVDSTTLALIRVARRMRSCSARPRRRHSRQPHCPR